MSGAKGVEADEAAEPAAAVDHRQAEERLDALSKKLRFLGCRLVGQGGRVRDQDRLACCHPSLPPRHSLDRSVLRTSHPGCDARGTPLVGVGHARAVLRETEQVGPLDLEELAQPFECPIENGVEVLRAGPRETSGDRGCSAFQLQPSRSLGLRLLGPGHVACSGIDQLPAGEGAPLDPAVAAVAAAVAVLEIQDRPLCIEASVCRARRLKVVGMHEIEEATSFQFLGRVAEGALPFRIDAQEDAIGAQDAEHVESGHEEPVEILRTGVDQTDQTRMATRQHSDHERERARQGESGERRDPSRPYGMPAHELRTRVGRHREDFTEDRNEAGQRRSDGQQAIRIPIRCERLEVSRAVEISDLQARGLVRPVAQHKGVHAQRGGDDTADIARVAEDRLKDTDTLRAPWLQYEGDGFACRGQVTECCRLDGGTAFWIRSKVETERLDVGCRGRRDEEDGVVIVAIRHGCAPPLYVLLPDPHVPDAGGLRPCAEVIPVRCVHPRRPTPCAYGGIVGEIGRIAGKVLRSDDRRALDEARQPLQLGVAQVAQGSGDRLGTRARQLGE